MPVKILITDDHPLIREGLRYTLGGERSLDIVGEAENGLEAVNFVRNCDVDVVLLDISMPVLNGVDACKIIKQEKPWVKIIALTVHNEDECLFDMIEAGASAYLLKDTSHDILIQAIWDTVRGGAFIPPNFATKVLAELSRLSRSVKTTGGFLGLTRREIEILGLLVQGCTNQEIATRLFICEQTVKNHLTRIFAKLNVPNRTQAALYAKKYRLLDI